MLHSTGCSIKLYTTTTIMKLLEKIFGNNNTTPKRIEKFCIDFEPKDDITTFELSKCLKFYIFCLYHKHLSAKEYGFTFKRECGDDNIKRHFVIKLENE